MPTAAKLVAAVCFAAIAWFAANAFIPVLPEGTRVGRFREIMGFIGLLCGWLIMGRLVGRGLGEAMGSGVRTSITIGFWGLLGFSLYEMVVRSTKMLYDGPMEALLGTFDLMLGYGRMTLEVPMVFAVLLVGGIIGGALAEFADRRWS